MSEDWNAFRSPLRLRDSKNNLRALTLNRVPPTGNSQRGIPRAQSIPPLANV